MGQKTQAIYVTKVRNLKIQQINIQDMHPVTKLRRESNAGDQIRPAQILDIQVREHRSRQQGEAHEYM